MTIALQITDLLVHQVPELGIYRDKKYISNYWMETTRGYVKYRRNTVGDEIYIHIFNKFNPKNKEKTERNTQH